MVKYTGALWTKLRILQTALSVRTLKRRCADRRLNTHQTRSAGFALISGRFETAAAPLKLNQPHIIRINFTQRAQFFIARLRRARRALVNIHVPACLRAHLL